MANKNIAAFCWAFFALLGSIQEYLDPVQKLCFPQHSLEID